MVVISDENYLLLPNYLVSHVAPDRKVRGHFGPVNDVCQLPYVININGLLYLYDMSTVVKEEKKKAAPKGGEVMGVTAINISSIDNFYGRKRWGAHSAYP